MASSSKESITERRLRPIYDYLDFGHHRKALAEADRVLKKQPDLLCARVLKALAMIRLKRIVEADALLREVESAVPVEDATLSAMVHCYKELAQPVRIMEAYDAAAKKSPSEELLSQLFMACVRVGDYRRQHQTAMALFKLVPKNPYYFWAIVSLIMQGIDDPEQGNKMYYPLAYRMLEKFRKEDKIEAEAEVQAYLMLLERVGRKAEILELLECDVIFNVPMRMMWNRERRVVQLLTELEDWPALFIRTIDMISRPDFSVRDTAVYYSLIESIVRLNAANDLSESGRNESQTSTSNGELANGEDGIDFAEKSQKMMEDVRSILDEHISRELYGPPLLQQLELNGDNEFNKSFIPRQNKKLDRTPFIALLEFCRRLDPESLPSAICRFVHVFAAKPSLLSDLLPFLMCLNPEERSQVVDGIDDDSSSGEEDDESKRESLHRSGPSQELCRQLAVEQIRWVLTSEQMTVDEMRDSVGRFLALADSLMGGDLIRCTTTSEETSEQAVKCQVATRLDWLGFHWLACMVQWRLYFETKKIAALTEILSICEYVTDLNPDAYYFRFLATKLYCLLGLWQEGNVMTDTLRLKYVQMESLGYFHHHPTLAWGFFADQANWARQMLAFYRQGGREIGETLIQAYRAGSFNQVLSFTQLLATLKISLIRVACDVEEVYSALFSPDHCGSNLSDFMSFFTVANLTISLPELSNWLDKRDFGVLNGLVVSGRPCLPADELKLQSFREVADILIYKQLFLRLLCSIMTANSHSSCGACKENMASATNGNVPHDGPEHIRYEGENLQNGQSSATANPDCEHPSMQNAMFSLVRHFEKCKTGLSPGNLSEIAYHQLAGPLPTYFDVFLQGDYFQLIQSVLDLVIEIVDSSSATSPMGISGQKSPSKPGLKGSPSEVAESLHSGGQLLVQSAELQDLLGNADVLQLLIRQMVASHQLKPEDIADNAHFPYRQLCHISFSVQTIGCCIFALLAAKRKLFPTTNVSSAADHHGDAGQSRGKRGKKKTAAPSKAEPLPEHLLHLGKIASLMVLVLGTLKNLLEDLSTMLDTGAAELSLSKPPLSIPEAMYALNHDIIKAKFANSYAESIKSIRAAMEHLVILGESILL